jgi:hypothetical protein
MHAWNRFQLGDFLGQEIVGIILIGQDQSYVRREAARLDSRSLAFGSQGSH